MCSRIEKFDDDGKRDRHNDKGDRSIATTRKINEDNDGDRLRWARVCGVEFFHRR